MKPHAPGPGYFGAIIWKEWRQLFKWGAAALCLIAVAFAQNLPRRDTLFEGMSVPASVPFAAFVLGLIQIRRDRRGDAWGFLTLRPAWRSTLFWGKVTAGVSIILIAAGVPTLVTLSWLATPGNLATPFEWRMAVPLMSAPVLGLIWYFAALFGGMRETRWGRSAFLAFMTAMVASGIAMNTPDFRSDIAVAAAAILLMMFAARGTFVAGGRYEAQSTATRALAGVIVTIGLAILGLQLMGFDSGGFAHEDREDLKENRQRYALTSDGTIAIETRNDKWELLAVTDLEHRPLAHYKPLDPEDNFWHWSGAGQLMESPETLAPYGWYHKTTRLLGRSFFEMDDEPKSMGRYVHSLGLIAVSEYRSERLIGWLGPDGYSPGETPPAKRFEGHLVEPESSISQSNGDRILALSSAAYLLNLQGRRITRVFQSPPGEEIVGAGFDAFVTTKAVYIQPADGTTKLRVPRDPRAAGYHSVMAVQAREKPDWPTFIWYHAYDEAAEPSPVLPSIVNAFNKDGDLIGRYTLPPLRTPRAIPWRLKMILAGAIPVTVSAALAVMQGPTSSIYLLWSPRYDGDYRHFRFASLGQRLLGWILSVLGGLCAAALNYTIGRKYAFPSGRLRLWTAVGFLLGPLGYLLMEELLEWPLRETCPSCIRPRIVTRLHCEHCGAPFSPPAPDGSEIFEHGTGFAAEGSR